MKNALVDVYKNTVHNERMSESVLDKILMKSPFSSDVIQVNDLSHSEGVKIPVTKDDYINIWSQKKVETQNEI